MKHLENPTTEPIVFIIPSSIKTDRLDKILPLLMKGYSRTLLQRWIKKGLIRVNSLLSEPKQLISPSDIITVFEPTELDTSIPAPIAFETVAESPDWIVINKPAGLVTHPGINNLSRTLFHGLLFYYPELESMDRAGIVHRLDKNTSGLMVVARNPKSRISLINQLKLRLVTREYSAFVHGHINQSNSIDSCIGRDRKLRTRMTIKNPIFPRVAITHYVPILTGYALSKEPVTEVVCYLETGRTHQIRAHMSGIGHPLFGDLLYGGKCLGEVKRQMLHSKRLSFRNPNGDSFVSFSSDLPTDMLNFREFIN